MLQAWWRIACLVLGVMWGILSFIEDDPVQKKLDIVLCIVSGLSLPREP